MFWRSDFKVSRVWGFFQDSKIAGILIFLSDMYFAIHGFMVIGDNLTLWFEAMLEIDPFTA